MTDKRVSISGTVCSSVRNWVSTERDMTKYSSVSAFVREAVEEKIAREKAVKPTPVIQKLSTNVSHRLKKVLKLKNVA